MVFRTFAKLFRGAHLRIVVWCFGIAEIMIAMLILRLANESLPTLVLQSFRSA